MLQLPCRWSVCSGTEAWLYRGTPIGMSRILTVVSFVEGLRRCVVGAPIAD